MQELASHGAGWLWLVGAAALICIAAAMVYGTMMWGQRRTDPAIRNARDAVTDAHYNDPEGQKP
jgi:hypothetical protein